MEELTSPAGPAPWTENALDGNTAPFPTVRADPEIITIARQQINFSVMAFHGKEQIRR
jgi:hypothetical protein